MERLLGRSSPSSRLALAILALWLPAAPAGAETYVWVDEHGVTHLSDSPPAERHTPADLDTLRGLWTHGPLGDPTRTPAGSGSSAEDRALRLLRAAVEDLARGETARAAATLRSALRLDPARAEPHWYLARLAERRGRYGKARRHLQAFVGAAGPGLGRWRDQARRRLGELEREEALADESGPPRPLRLAPVTSPHFRVEVDAELTRPGSDYADAVLGFLEDARSRVAARLGVVPQEPLGVVFYGKAAYQQAHGHRFSFRTVGFFDGRIHVASTARPSLELRALVTHEYTHAVFREQTGGDRPYWLNEGLAERLEREVRGLPISTRSERASLNRRIRSGDWIPLRRIGPSFSGLRDQDARAAYLQAIEAARWIEENSDAEGRAELLGMLGQGYSIDQALHSVLGVDVAGLDRALRAHLASEFPQVETRAASPAGDAAP